MKRENANASLQRRPLGVAPLASVVGGAGARGGGVRWGGDLVMEQCWNQTCRGRRESLSRAALARGDHKRHCVLQCSAGERLGVLARRRLRRRHCSSRLHRRGGSAAIGRRHGLLGSRRSRRRRSGRGTGSERRGHRAVGQRRGRTLCCKLDGELELAGGACLGDGLPGSEQRGPRGWGRIGTGKGAPAVPRG